MNIFNILPMSDRRYNTAMNKLTNTFKFEGSNVVALNILLTLKTVFDTTSSQD